MIDGTLRNLGGDELTDEWVEAFRLLAADYQNRNLLATVELIGDELKARGLPLPKERVTSEMTYIAQKMREVSAEQAPAGIAGVQSRLEDDLMSFVAERNAKSERE
jgi:hypothetical protein